jgi:hypothetical protein
MNALARIRRTDWKVRDLGPLQYEQSLDPQVGFAWRIHRKPWVLADFRPPSGHIARMLGARLGGVGALPHECRVHSLSPKPQRCAPKSTANQIAPAKALQSYWSSVASGAVPLMAGSPAIITDYEACDVHRFEF